MMYSGDMDTPKPQFKHYLLRKVPIDVWYALRMLALEEKTTARQIVLTLIESHLLAKGKFPGQEKP